MALAMHMSDGLVNAPTSVAFGLLAVLVLAVAVSRARADLDDRTAPMAGLVAAFIFAVQMLNFPVLPGVSGHLLGGALAAILVGPWVGALCVATVLIVQACCSPTAGSPRSALNITNMALIGTAAGYLVVVALLRARCRSRGRAGGRRVRRRRSSASWSPRRASCSSTRSAARRRSRSARSSR